MTTRSLLLFLILALQLTACGVGGGGGNGDSAPSAAEVDVDADPSNIDTGDRMSVAVYLYEISDGGVMLKIKTPVGLDYVTDSGILEVDGQNIDVSPTTNKSDAAANYIVYFLPRRFFGDSNQGILHIRYSASAAIAKGSIDVDPDFNDPDVTDSKEFSIDAPNFSAEASKEIVVTG